MIKVTKEQCLDWVVPRVKMLVCTDHHDEGVYTFTLRYKGEDGGEIQATYTIDPLESGSSGLYYLKDDYKEED